MIQDLRIDFSHHAYCLEGDVAHVKDEVLRVLEQSLGFKTKANLDFWLGEFDTFGIDDSRRVSSFQVGKAMSGDKKIIMLTLNSMTREAQNSLLKTFLTDVRITGTL